MMKKFFNLYFEDDESGEVIRAKSELWEKYRDIFSFDEKDFVISESKDKLKILELVNFELLNMLTIRTEPPVPAIQYVPLDQMYVLKRVFGKEVKLLQGNEFDNNVLSLINFKSLLEVSIKENKRLFGRFVNTIKECTNK